MLNSDVFVLKHNFNRLHKIGSALLSHLPAWSVRAPSGKSYALTSLDVRCSCWRSFAFSFSFADSYLCACRYAVGETPTCSRKNLPIDDWLPKCSSSDISFIDFVVVFKSRRSSSVVYMSSQSLGVRLLTRFTVSSRVFGVMPMRSLYQPTFRVWRKLRSTSVIYFSNSSCARVWLCGIDATARRVIWHRS